MFYFLICAVKNKYKQENAEHNALKNNYAALKKTWELANQHFVDSQNSLEQKISFLTKQLEAVSAGNRYVHKVIIILTSCSTCHVLCSK